MALYGLLLLFMVLALCNIVQLNGMQFWDQQSLSEKKTDDVNTNKAVVRRKIVDYHNFFRMRVQPPASNMLYMSWHPGAAAQAEKYAKKCIFGKHNSGLERTVPSLGTCGQNIYASTNKVSWFSATKSWFSEYQNFTFGNRKVNVPAVGHYTQMVWATSFKVGCGVAKCTGGPWGQFYNYICHYCPGGNYNTIIHYPYKSGMPCSECPDQCLKGKLCLNSCPVKDVYSNCKHLLSIIPGYCEHGTCNATCNCGNRRIYRK